MSLQRGSFQALNDRCIGLQFRRVVPCDMRC